MNLREAIDYWQAAFGDEPFSLLTDQDKIGNLRHRGADFADCVVALEMAQAYPSAAVLDAAAERATELAR